jgi:hypothetical protein
MIAAEGFPEGLRPTSPEGSFREVWEQLSLGTPASSSDKRKGPLIFRPAGLSCNPADLANLLHLVRQHVVNQRLIWHLPFCCNGPQPAKHLGIKTDGDELSWFISQGRSPNPTHRGQLRVRQWGNV